jgi:hypothetical protein
VIELETPLREFGWDTKTAGNFRGALSQGAFVMQTLRSKMDDVHGSKPILKPLVFDVLKWAELFAHAHGPLSWPARRDR